MTNRKVDQVARDYIVSLVVVRVREQVDPGVRMQFSTSRVYRETFFAMGRVEFRWMFSRTILR
ncbi:hypothetical protein LCGC14_1571420 [marine sediment metagenome]|uniref:Uncharacterized protein n=1 Tax=marine sediment metagenome TaxID=412755 RepID=A0A0F9L0R2_9ZZZZ